MDEGRRLTDEKIEEIVESMSDQIERQGQDMGRFVSGLADEGDRSAVILGAARLDVGLERLLQRVMVPHPGGQDNLFGPDRPLGSFSAKIALAFRLGLIDAKTEHGLQMVRKMRNDFAHSLDTASLSDGPQRNRVRELVRDTRSVNSSWQAVRDLLEGNYSESVADFCAAMVTLLIRVEVVPDTLDYEIKRTLRPNLGDRSENSPDT